MAKLPVLLLPLLLPLIASLTSSEDLARSPEPLTIEGGGGAETELVEWAVGRFAAAGLDLPPITVRFLGEDLALCDGAQARAHVAKGEVVLRVCWYDPFVVLHELGHVWEAHNVPVERHEQFMGLRDGVEAWSSVEVSWDARGREHAANVIAWGLLADPYPISRTYPNDVVSMIDAFTFLTNVSPLHDGGTGVQHPDRSLIDGRQNEPLESGR
jgi:hypothetical protein